LTQREKDKIVTANVNLSKSLVHAVRDRLTSEESFSQSALGGIQMKANTRKRITREKK